MTSMVPILRPGSLEPTPAPTGRLRLYADGWYRLKGDARDCMDLCAELGAVPLGLVESEHESWGFLYASTCELFSNHRLDSGNALWAPLRRHNRV